MNKKLFLSFAIFMLYFQSFSLANQIPYETKDTAVLKRIISGNEKLISQFPQDKKALKIVGIAYHNLSAEGDKSSTPKAKKYLENAAKLLPEDYEIFAYQGSTKTLEGRDAVNPIQRIMLVNEGIRMIDAAVKKDSEDFFIRMIRINNSLALPSFFRRQDAAEEDLGFLLKNEKKLDPSFLSQVYFLSGEISKNKDQLDEAKKYWEKSIKVDPKSIYGLEAKDRLEEFSF